MSNLRWAITKTTEKGRPYLFIREMDGSILITTKIEEAYLFDTKELAQQYYTEFVLPNVLMGDNPLEIFDSISTIRLEFSFEMDYPLNKKGVKE